MADPRIGSRRFPSRWRLPLAFSAAVVLLGAPAPGAQGPGLEKITHLIVIYQENWSFDGLSGRFPGADGRWTTASFTSRSAGLS